MYISIFAKQIKKLNVFTYNMNTRTKVMDSIASRTRSHDITIRPILNTKKVKNDKKRTHPMLLRNWKFHSESFSFSNRHKDFIYEVDFDFDDASEQWRKNKISKGNGTYVYA